MPPTPFSLNSCKRHSVHSNNQMIELVDIFQTIRQNLGPYDPKFTDSLTNIGITHFRHGEYDLSVDAFESAYSIYKTAHGHNHFLVATLLENLGITYMSLGKFLKVPNLLRTLFGFKVVMQTEMIMSK